MHVRRNYNMGHAVMMEACWVLLFFWARDAVAAVVLNPKKTCSQSEEWRHPCCTLEKGHRVERSPFIINRLIFSKTGKGNNGGMNKDLQHFDKLPTPHIPRTN